VVSERLQKRLDRSLRATQPRNADRLWDFLEQYEIPERGFESWKELRNRSVRGGQIPMTDVHKVFRELIEVLYLCYSIVLSFIKFTGPRTDCLKLEVAALGVTAHRNF
jgi:hypothetical protein